MKLPSELSYEAERVGIPLCGNILTENVVIINGLCKEVAKLMHLLQGVTSVEPSLLPSWIIPALAHTHSKLLLMNTL